jgi:hypothetical protein
VEFEEGIDAVANIYEDRELQDVNDGLGFFDALPIRR